jgi:hypothetical protein
MRCDALLDFQVAHFVSHVFGNAPPCDDGDGDDGDMHANRIAEVLLHELELEMGREIRCMFVFSLTISPLPCKLSMILTDRSTA